MDDVWLDHIGHCKVMNWNKAHVDNFFRYAQLVKSHCDLVRNRQYQSWVLVKLTPIQRRPSNLKLVQVSRPFKFGLSTAQVCLSSAGYTFNCIYLASFQIAP